MKRLLFIALICMLLIPFTLAADDPVQIEKDAVKELYSTGKDIASYADTMDPMQKGKWTDESKAILSAKIGYLELALTSINAIVEDAGYSTNPNGLGDLEDTYNKAATAKKRIEAQIEELKKYQEGEVLEDGELDGSGLLWDDKYDNGDFKTKLKEIGVEKADEDTWYDWEGYSKWWWILLVGLIVLSVVKKNSISAMISNSNKRYKWIEVIDKSTTLNKAIISLMYALDQHLKEAKRTFPIKDTEISEVSKEISEYIASISSIDDADLKTERVTKENVTKRLESIFGTDPKKEIIGKIGSTLNSIEKIFEERAALQKEYLEATKTAKEKLGKLETKK